MSSMEEQKVSQGNKVFVGNVPFQCTIEEFRDLFKNMDGFIDADIIKRHKSKLSRGFGFVIFDTEQHAEALINREDINLNDRTLRFSNYSLQINDKGKNQIFISNIDDKFDDDKLRDFLSQYGVVKSCAIVEKNSKLHAIATFEDSDGYTKALDDSIKNDMKLDIRPYKKINIVKNKYVTNPKVAYREGFRAGHIAGFQEGFKQGIVHKNNINSM